MDSETSTSLKSNLDLKKIFLATSLFDSIEDGNLGHVKQVLRDGDADPNTILPNHGFSPFHFVIGNDDHKFAEEVTKLFLQHGGDPNVQSDEKLTPVHIAASWGCTKLLHLLLLNGGNPWLKDVYDMNAIQYAFQESNWDAVDLLHKFYLMESSVNYSCNETCYKRILERIIVSEGDVCIEYAVKDPKSNNCVTTQTSVNNLKSITSPIDFSMDMFSEFKPTTENRSSSRLLCNRKSLLPNPSYKTENSQKLENKDSSCSNSKNAEIVVYNHHISGIEHLPRSKELSGVLYDYKGIENWLAISSSTQSSSSIYHTCEDQSVADINALLSISVAPENNCEQTVVISDEEDEKLYFHGVRTDSLNADQGKLSCSSTNRSFATVAEEYKYTDDDEGIVLLERRFLVPPVSSADLSDKKIHQSGDNSDSYDTDALREELKARGYVPGPITATTKRVYSKQLQRIPPAPPAGDRVYSPELEDTLSNVDWKTFVTPCIELEKEVASQFAEPDPKRRWRGGLAKSSFTYLLLDPRVTNNLPCRVTELSEAQTWSTFLESVFYVGKGKRARPYSHLYEAFSAWSGNRASSENNQKVQCIVDIWRAGHGVICLHIFQNVIPAEAYTREAAMIDAVDLRNLRNAKHGGGLYSNGQLTNIIVYFIRHC